MEAYKEYSTVSTSWKLLQWTTLGLIALSWIYEAYHTFAMGQFSLMGWGYNVLFVILWAWRCLFRYSYTLTDQELIIEMLGLGLHRTLRIPLDQMESFTNHYKRSFFRKTAIKKYVRRYSSIDPQPDRLLVYRDKGTLCGLLFKCSDRMIDLLARRYPNQFLDFPE